MVGGEKWVPGTESPCSIGFSVTRSGGTKAFLTAGHCTNDADQAAYGKDGTRVGTSNKNGTGSVNAAEGDFGIVDVDQAGWQTAPAVSGWGKGDVTLTGSAEAVVGTAICRSGQTTGFQCGEVTKVNQSVDYGNVVINGLSYSSACSAGGDSGGSYVTATGGKAVGLHSGGGSATCSSGSGEKFTIFQPVNEALAKFGASLVTSAPQPGEVTVAAVSARTGPTGTPVELRNSAEGGTALHLVRHRPPGRPVRRPGHRDDIRHPDHGRHLLRHRHGHRHRRPQGLHLLHLDRHRPRHGSPVLAAPGNQNLTVGRPFSLALRASGGTAPYAFSATGLPAGLGIDAATGLVSGTPTAWGFRNVTLTVTDATGKKASATATFTVWS